MSDFRLGKVAPLQGAANVFAIDGHDSTMAEVRPYQQIQSALPTQRAHAGNGVPGASDEGWAQPGHAGTYGNAVKSHLRQHPTSSA